MMQSCRPTALVRRAVRLPSQHYLATASAAGGVMSLSYSHTELRQTRFSVRQAVPRQRYLATDAAGGEVLVSLSSYPHSERRQTRFSDSDAFGHINNAVYYQYMDDSINLPLLKLGFGISYPRFVAENGMEYFEPVTFPTQIDVGIRVVKLGKSSVTYDVGMFRADDGVLAARGKFVHVYVDKDGRPTPIDREVRNVLQEILVE